MPEMLRFEVPERVDDAFFKFGVLLLDDKTGRKMANIIDECGDDYGRIVRVTLKKWIHGDGRLPMTWKTFIKTLRDCELCSLAAEIEAKKIDGTAQWHLYIFLRAILFINRGYSYRQLFWRRYIIGL